MARPSDFSYRQPMNENLSPEEQTVALAGGPVVSERGFWIAFGFGWMALSGLIVSAGLTETGDLGQAVLGAVASVGPPAGLATLVASRRRDLLRSEWTLGRTVITHVLVGLLYAIGAALLSMVLERVLDIRWGEAGLESAGPALMFFFRIASGIFFYVILAGFLMWTESLVRVHESRTLAAREAALRSKAEAKALRAQFNPHFVFNTLHSLMLLIRAEPETAERAIEDVAALIRYASVLQREGVDTVPLEKELEIARRYAALEQLRLEDRLRIEWDVAPDLDRLAIPAFSLQTLLENAIKHGVAPSPEGANVRLRATEADGRLTLEVEDDGPGVDPSTVAMAKGRGIDLLTQRLAALHGGEASLDVETAPGAGFRVRVSLPAS